MRFALLFLCAVLFAFIPAGSAWAQADSDGDGIPNALELSGFAFDIISGEVEACTPGVDDPCFVTDPLSWSSDGDPYSDFQEASGVNMDATVRVPYNSPLVAAYPVIEVVLAQYAFTSNAEITDTSGRTLSSGESFTSSVETTTTSSVTVGVGASSDGLSLGVEGSYSYSETVGYASTTTSGQELNWETATSTDLDDAGTLSLSLFARNTGGATALDVRPTFNVYIGGDLVATVLPDAPFRQSLAPGEASAPVVPIVNSAPLALQLSFDRLQALQLGAPVRIQVVDILADIQRWRPQDSNWECGSGETCSWTSFQNQILPRTLRLLVDFGYSGDPDAEIPFEFRGNPFEYRVYTGSPSTSPDFTLRDVLRIVDYDLDGTGNSVRIEGRPYPEGWVLAEEPDAGGFTPIQEAWQAAGSPSGLLDVVMPRQATLFMTSPDPDAPGAAIRSTAFTRDLLSVRAFAAPRGGLLIESAAAHVFENGVERVVPLVLAENGAFWTTEVGAVDEPIGARSSFVAFTDVSGAVQRASIELPVPQVASCADVAPGDLVDVRDNAGLAILFPNGDLDVPVEAYCEIGSEVTRYWVPQTTPGGGLEISDIAILDDRTAIAVGRAVVMRTEDRGRTWQEVPNALPRGYNLGLDVNPASGTLIASGNVREQEGVTYRSTDGGLTWQTISGETQVLRNVAYAGDGVWYRGGGAGGVETPQVRKSTDDGRTWSRLTFPARLVSVAGIDFRDASTGIISEGRGSGEGANSLWRTTDGGQTWTEVFSNGDRGIGGVTYAGDDTWYATQGDFFDVGYARLYRSRQNGAAGTWEAIGMTAWANAPRSLLFLTPDVGFVTDGTSTAGPGRGLLRTDDGGATWTTETPLSDDLGIRPVVAFDDNRILAVGGITGIAMTTSGGDGRPFTEVAATPETAVPSSVGLGQNYPNPFTGETMLTYTLASPTSVAVTVFDMLGREVARLVDGPQPAGTHTVLFDGRRMAPGVYVVRLRAGDAVVTRRMTRVR